LTFANLIFALFLLFSIAIFVVLVLLIRKIKQQGSLAPEKMTTLTAILFIPALLFFSFMFKNISNWRADIQQEQHRIKLESFISKVYQPLSSARKELRNDLFQMQALIEKVESMELTHPNHSDLIRKVREQWSLGHKALYNAYIETDKEVRRAWIAHNTMDRQDVLLKFSKQAVQIESQIKKAQDDYQTHLYSVQGDMVKRLDQARKLLDANRKPPKTKEQIDRNQVLRDKIRPTSSAISTELQDFVATFDERLSNDIKTVHELIRISGQQTAVLRDHLNNNRDLEQPLTKIIHDWKALEDKSNGGLKEIYYALEAEYVVRKLGLPAKSPAIKAMHQTLLKAIPAIKGEGIRQKRVIDQSYSINLNTNN